MGSQFSKGVTLSTFFQRLRVASPYDKPSHNTAWILGAATKRFLESSRSEKFDKIVRVLRRPLFRMRGRQWDKIQEAEPRFVLVNRSERFLLDSRDQVISRAIYRRGYHDLPVFINALNILKFPQNRVNKLVDVGANIGDICVSAVARGLANQAIAVEADSHNFKLLTTNILLNNLQGKISAHQVAAGSSDGQAIQLLRSETNFGDHQIRPITNSEILNSIEVTERSLDSLAPMLDAKTDLVWIDVQGYEVQVLRGSSEICRTCVPIVMEISPEHLKNHGNVDDLLDCVSSYKGFFDLARYRPIFQPIVNLRELYADLDSRKSFTDILLK